MDTTMIECFKNLTIKKDCLLSKEELLKNGIIEMVTDTNDNQHIVLKPGQTFNDLTPIEKLYVYGVTTIPILSSSQLDEYRTNLKQEMELFPEYLRNSGNKLVYVLGGFGALGNPSSFHNPTIRRLRKKVYQQAVARLFRQLVNDYQTEVENNDQQQTYYLESLLDRFMYRLKGTAPSAESWHRDVANDKLIEFYDEIYGGWINLDTESQFMSCIPGSHLGVRLKGLQSGFATIGKKDIDKFKPYKQLFEIKPGHCIIFPQYLLHEVVSKKAPYDMMRLFTGWRLSTTGNSFYTQEELDRIIETQATPPLPSGQKTPMFAANHGSFFLKKNFTIDPTTNYSSNTIDWSKDSFQPQLLVAKKEYLIVDRYLKSLEEYGLDKYDDYTQEERKILYPHKLS